MGRLFVPQRTHNHFVIIYYICVITYNVCGQSLRVAQSGAPLLLPQPYNMTICDVDTPHQNGSPLPPRRLFRGRSIRGRRSGCGCESSRNCASPRAISCVCRSFHCPFSAPASSGWRKREPGQHAAPAVRGGSGAGVVRSGLQGSPESRRVPLLTDAPAPSHHRRQDAASQTHQPANPQPHTYTQHRHKLRFSFFLVFAFSI